VGLTTDAVNEFKSENDYIWHATANLGTKSNPNIDPYDLKLFHDESSYIGNPELSGDHLPTNRSSLLPGNGEQETKHEDSTDGDDDKTGRLGLYASIAVGYITGFWVVCGSLMLKRSWRHAYFKFVFDMRDKLLDLMAVYMARVKRRFGLERN
jgi:hypothetical protein